MNSSKVIKKIPKKQAYTNENLEPKVNLYDGKNQNIQIESQVDETKRIVEAFKTFDIDGDGFVSVREFVTIMSTYAPDLSSKDIDEIVKESGLEDKGKMDYREFVDFWNNFS